MSRFTVDIECRSCKATGLYSGMGESKETAVVCHTCKGTGSERFDLAYKPFTVRRYKPGIEHVYQTNPGIKVGRGGGYEPGDFGGMPYRDWQAGRTFNRGTENRKFICPAWWYQSADYKQKPNWKECLDTLGGTFASCRHFKDKAKCWGRFDAEAVKHD